MAVRQKAFHAAKTFQNKFNNLQIKTRVNTARLVAGQRGMAPEEGPAYFVFLKER